MSRANRLPRIAFYDNVCNFNYHAVRALRQECGLDAHLFLDARFDPQRLPENDDPALAGAYPDWIHRRAYETFSTVAFPWSSALLAELKNFDLIVTQGWGVRFPAFTGRPYIIWTSGGDITINPFPLDHLKDWPRWKDRLGVLLKGFWQRWGIRHAGEIWASPFAPYQTAYEKLKINRTQVSTAHYPVIVNAQWLDDQNPVASASNACTREIRDRFDFVVFHPSRLALKKDPRLVQAGDWKGNDVLFEGFARLVRERPEQRVGLVLVKRDQSFDYRLACEQLEALGLKDCVYWAQPLRDYGFTRQEMIPLYAASDVVAVDFGAGWFGSVALEALSMRRPVLTHIDEEAICKIYTWHPMLSCKEPVDIHSLLARLMRDKPFRLECGERGRQWIQEYHAYATAGRRFGAGLVEYWRKVVSAGGS